MKFGIAYATHPGIVGNVELAEELGYDSVHLYDSPLVFSELFVVAGMVAARTERIGISISVAVPFLRLPHVLASGVGTLSQAAPGRISLGFGTGFTAALTTGVSADSWATVRETIRIVRGILADEETEATIKGERRTIKHLHADLGHINVHDQVPIAISAAGPKGLGVVGEVADAFFTMSAGQRPTPVTVSPTIGVVQERAAELGRDPLPVTLFTTMAIKDPDEPANSERLLGFVGPAVSQHFHGNLGFGPEDERTPPRLRAAAQQYHQEVGRHIDGEAPWLLQHRGHAMVVREEEAHLLTAELIEDVCQIGTPDELIEEIAALEDAGIDEIVWQQMPGHDVETERFAREVMVPYRSSVRA